MASSSEPGMSVFKAASSWDFAFWKRLQVSLRLFNLGHDCYRLDTIRIMDYRW